MRVDMIPPASRPPVLRPGAAIPAILLAIALPAALLAGSPGAAHAQAAPGVPAAAGTAGQTDAASAPIAALYAGLGRIEHSHGSFAERSQIVAPFIDRAFDLQTVLQNSLGLRYRTIPEAQKAALLDQFRQFTIARYVSNFAPGGTDTFKVDPAATPAPVPNEQIVHTHIVSGDATTDVNYVMRQGTTPGADGWRVVDVLLNGNISQVAVQRADFGSSLESGDASSLIESLKKKTAAFQGG